jgi:hypothetical protein
MIWASSWVCVLFFLANDVPPNQNVKKYPPCSIICAVAVVDQCKFIVKKNQVNIRENKGEWFGMMYLLGAIRRL